MFLNIGIAGRIKPLENVVEAADCMITIPAILCEILSFSYQPLCHVLFNPGVIVKSEARNQLVVLVHTLEKMTRVSQLLRQKQLCPRKSVTTELILDSRKEGNQLPSCFC